MQLATLLKKLNTLNLPKDQYVITSSASLAVRGIREAKDLDIFVSEKLWHKLAEKYGISYSPLESIIIGNIEALWKSSNFVDPEVASPEELLESKEMIQGYPYASLEVLRKLKALGKREKDIRDVKLIDEYLAKNRK